ncbi:MAG: 50S ribosomal protein L1 [Puniceicoccales bacterium]|jgi:large subunit ribosomal protein L1|nr:50S ribosomal protein L1 [Puniceicoccales bacterium]
MMKKRSKRYRASGDPVERMAGHGVSNAIGQLLAMARAKFDETVELAVRLGFTSKQGDQSVRGIVKLPHGSGKTMRVVAFTERPEEAIAAGAMHAGLRDLITKIESGWCDFDVAVATTSAMKEVRSVAKILGPRGLMPSPKAGTVGDDVEKIIGEVKAGRSEFKMDKAANISIAVGKCSFEKSALEENIREALAAIARARPESTKDGMIRSAFISSTMSPSIAIDVMDEIRLGN